MRKTLTVITTTYNRAYCLRQVYDSLVAQESDDFLWLVIDDGSDDGTNALIEELSNQGELEIRYLWKPNGGMHTARNLGYATVDTELNMIVDSDDWLAPDAISKIVEWWRCYSRPWHAGIIGLNVSPIGKVIGSGMPVGVTEATVGEFFGTLRASGDKKLVYRSDLTRLFPYPEYEGEKFFPASYKFRLIDRTHRMLLLDEALCVVDYNDDSMSRHKIDQYFESPNGFVFHRRALLELDDPFAARFRTAVHYVAECRIANQRDYIRTSPTPLLCAFALPFGVVYHAFLLVARRRGRR